MKQFKLNSILFPILNACFQRTVQVEPNSICQQYTVASNGHIFAATASALNAPQISLELQGSVATVQMHSRIINEDVGPYQTLRHLIYSCIK